MYPGLLVSAGPAIKAGKARPLAAFSLKRIPAMPDLPTVAEQGFPGFKITNSYSLFAPAGTPRPIIDKLHAELFRDRARVLSRGTAEAQQREP